VVRVRIVAGVLIVCVSLVGGCRGAASPTTAASPAATTSEPADDAADIEAIRATFEEYRRHLIARNGAAVWDVVSPSTVDYYNELARLVATAGQDELASRPLVDRFTVARFRVDLPADQLAAMDGRAVLAHGVDQGYVDQSSVADARLGDVRIAGDRGFAPLAAGPQPSDVDFEFVRVGEDWKFDLAATMPHANAAFSEMARESGLTEDEFVFEMIEILSGERVDASIYNRP
jgi:hypothetical protein